MSNALSIVSGIIAWTIGAFLLALLVIFPLRNSRLYSAAGYFYLSMGIVGIILSVLLLANLSASLLGVTLALVTNPAFLIPCILTAFLLFRLRRSQPLIYGLIEVFVGTTTILFVVQNTNVDLSAKLIGIIGGIYIIIRGLDNAERGLPDRLKPLWDVAFPKAK